LTDRSATTEVVAACRSWSSGEPTSVWFAPGRVNLIGEHTDHAGGFVLPFAVQQGVIAAVRTTEGAPGIRCRSLTFDDTFEMPLTDLVRAPRPWASGWARYVAGAVGVLVETEQLSIGDLPGLDIVVGSDLPAGAGLSSSAALECATLAAVASSLGIALEPSVLAAAGRRVEHEFVGVPCGPMDQLASVFGEADRALLIDCRDLTIESVPVPFADAALVPLVIDTRVHHDLSDGGYERRHAECDLAATQLGVRSLRDADPISVAASTSLDAVTRRRARHVTTEIERVLQAVSYLRRGDIVGIGPLLDESHTSLRDDFEVSCVELDVAVEFARAAGAVGARMIGGGFGGSVLVLAPAHMVDAVIDAVQTEYRRRAWKAPDHWIVEPSAGLRQIDTDVIR
jgi:galactokinase